MATHTTFKDVPHGSYFVPNKFTSAIGWHTFVKHGEDYADPISLDGTCFLGMQDRLWDIEPDFPVVLLEEGEWPEVKYDLSIQWNWDYIKEQVEKNIFPDRDDPHSGNVYGTCWIGTTIGVMPSGKIYAMWTSNQTDEDVNRDGYFQEAMEAEAKKHGYFIDYGDSGDIFVSKCFTYQEVAEKAGYNVIPEVDGTFFWVKDGESSGDFESEDEAWRDCCEVNRLVQE